MATTTTVWDRLTQDENKTDPMKLPPKERLELLPKRAKAMLLRSVDNGALAPTARQDDLNKIIAFGFFNDRDWALTTEAYEAFGKKKPDTRSLSEKIRDGVYVSTIPHPRSRDYEGGSQNPHYVQDRKRYHEDIGRLNAKFKEDLFKEHGVEGHPKAEKCYAIAYDHGHSAGMSEVANYFEEFVELIK